MSHSWRDLARPIIARVLSETANSGEKVIRKALFDAYPFHERAMHPYKIWLDEIQRQRGLKKPAGCRAAQAKLTEWESIYGKRQAP